jgi:protein-tyrosine phosphatase
MRVLMVCLGNICRSPLAEGILRAKAKEKGLAIEVDSAGTGGWHAGEAPDRRSQKVALQNGIDISHQKARKFKLQDFDDFDLILAMDTENMKDLLLLAPNEMARAKVKLILNYINPTKNQNVPDPYYGQMADFEAVFNLLDQALEKFLNASLNV